MYNCGRILRGAAVSPHSRDVKRGGLPFRAGGGRLRHAVRETLRDRRKLKYRDWVWAARSDTSSARACAGKRKTEGSNAAFMLTSRRNILIEWGDCDPAGIVYFPRYFEIFDACTAALFNAAGLPCGQMIAIHEIVGIPMVDIHARFMIPSKPGDEVTVETTITEFRRSSFVIRHRLYKGEDLAIECEETRVWAGKHPEDAGRLKGKAIPPDVIARFKNESAQRAP